jgi:glutathione S-transferase
MELVYVVILLALVEYIVFTGLVGRARVRYRVLAPATTGDPAFERAYRVHQNTLENLIVFVPAIWIFAMYASALWAAVLGVVFIVGRAIYAVGYLQAAEKRGPGAGITGLTNVVLVAGSLIAVLADLF